MRLDHNVLNVMVFLFEVGQDKMNIHARKMSSSSVGQKNFKKTIMRLTNNKIPEHS